MLNTIIIEDETAARQSLIKTLTEIDDTIQVTAQLSTVKESIDHLKRSPEADLIFSDVQLSDGLSFEIFSEAAINTPVIFITGYDQFMMNAFEYNGIDYLLKPVAKEELRKALVKYRMLEKHFNPQSNLDKLFQYVNSRKKTRLIVRKGMENLSIKLEDIVFFYTENKIVYVIDKLGKKYLSDKNLGELEQELDDTNFFRANRQYIININYIKGFKAYEKVKLVVDMMLPESERCIIISQETAPAFRKWMSEA